MCGIVGYAGFAPGKINLAGMNDSIFHRGPDDAGEFTHEQTGLAMRRLSIIDVSAGHQPMFSEDRNYVIVFNGEIYNYRELRADLCARGHHFQTHSDTEVILRLYEIHGTKVLEFINGMFTFAIYNTQERTLFVARDHIGVKPLYLWNEGSALIFASEIKAILASGVVERQPNLDVIDEFMSLRYAPGPETMFRGIQKFPAGHYMLADKKGVSIRRYWDITHTELQDISQQEADERFSELFLQSVKSQMVADVPVGAFISGGLDSTAIVAAMGQFSNRPTSVYSVGFGWAGDELEAAADTAGQLGLELHSITCQESDFDLLPQIIWHLDEPLGDAITLPMFLLAKRAAKDVKVVLTGDGADEILGGYFIQRVLKYSYALSKYAPDAALSLGSKLASLMPVGLISSAFDYPVTLGNRGKKRLVDYLELIKGRNLPSQYKAIISLFDARDKANLYVGDLREVANRKAAVLMEPTQFDQDYLQHASRLQFDHWLSDNILMKQDKMCMANSLENRVPFLDHELVEFAMSLPAQRKVKGKANKKPLRKFLHSHSLSRVAKRKKVPFYIPVEQFMSKGPMADMLHDCLSESAIKNRGYFEYSEVEKIKSLAADGEFLYAKQLFSMITLELWHRLFMDKSHADSAAH